MSSAVTTVAQCDTTLYELLCNKYGENRVSHVVATLESSIRKYRGMNHGRDCKDVWNSLFRTIVSATPIKSLNQFFDANPRLGQLDDFINARMSQHPSYRLFGRSNIEQYRDDTPRYDDDNTEDIPVLSQYDLITIKIGSNGMKRKRDERHHLEEGYTEGVLSLALPLDCQNHILSYIVNPHL